MSQAPFICRCSYPAHTLLTASTGAHQRPPISACQPPNCNSPIPPNSIAQSYARALRVAQAAQCSDATAAVLQLQVKPPAYLCKCAIIVPNADDALHVRAERNAADLPWQTHGRDWRQQRHGLLLRLLRALRPLAAAAAA